MKLPNYLEIFPTIKNDAWYTYLPHPLAHSAYFSQRYLP